MARSKLKNYVRAYRKQTGLSQREIAYLLGCKSGAKVCRYEGFSRQPTIQTVFAYEAVFGVSAQNLFAGIHQEAHERTVQRARVLARKISRRPIGQDEARKLEALRAIVAGQTAAY